MRDIEQLVEEVLAIRDNRGCDIDSAVRAVVQNDDEETKVFEFLEQEYGIY